MSKTDKIKLGGILLTVCGGICWGLSGCFGEYLFTEKGITAGWLVSVRQILSGILLVAIGFAADGSKKMTEIFKSKRDMKRLVLFAVFGVLLSQFAYFYAIQYSNAATATVLQSLNPLLILAVICITRMRFPKTVEIGGIIFAVWGTFLISTHGSLQNFSISREGLFFGLASAVGAAVYGMLSGELMKKYGTYVVVGYGMVIAAVIVTAAVRPWRYEVAWDMGAVLGVIGVTIIGTALSFSLFLKGVSIIGPFLGSLLGTIEPVTAIVVSVLFLNADFHRAELTGFVMILVTVTVLSVYPNEGLGGKNKDKDIDIGQ